jgi:hypothetical protein
MDDKSTREIFEAERSSRPREKPADLVAVANALQKPEHRFMLPPGECAYCDRERASAIAAGRDPTSVFMPSHDAMPHCRSGGHSHCTCDSCF